MHRLGLPFLDDGFVYQRFIHWQSWHWIIVLIVVLEIVVLLLRLLLLHRCSCSSSLLFLPNLLLLGSMRDLRLSDSLLKLLLLLLRRETLSAHIKGSHRIPCHMHREDQTRHFLTGRDQCFMTDHSLQLVLNL